ncbi:EAL domain-containing protein [Enterobacter hormaechei]
MSSFKHTNILLLVLFFILSMLIGLYTTFVQMQNALDKELRKSLHHAMKSIDLTLFHGQKAANEASQWLGRDCNDVVLTGIRTLVATIPDVRTVNLVKGDEIYCTSVFGGVNYKIHLADYDHGGLLILQGNSVTPTRSLLVYKGDDKPDGTALAGIDGYYIYNVLSAVQGKSTFYILVGSQAMDAEGKVSAVPELENPVLIHSSHFDYTLMADTHFLSTPAVFLQQQKEMILIVTFFSFLTTLLFSRYLLYRQTIEFKLKNALTRKQIVPVIQPIIDGVNQKIVGGEVLLRWRHPVQGNIPPDVFISAAEQAGLIKSVTHYCFRKVTKALNDSCLNAESSLLICFNVSANEFTTGEIIQTCRSFSDTFSHRGIQPVLEITERDKVHRSEEILQVLKELRSAGVKFSLDDFGTGNANYHYISLFTPDYLKIDKIFTDDFEVNSFSMEVIKSIITIAKSTGCLTIAEGVENEEQFLALKRMGVDYFQGYYFSVPIPFVDFLSKVSKQQD